MRSLAATLAVLATLHLAAPAHADVDVLVPAHLVPAAVAPQNLGLVRAHLEEQAHDARVLRNTGIAFTVLGTVMTGLGVGLFMGGFCMDSCHGNDALAPAGIGVLTLGQLGVVAGIPMWAAGQARASRAEAAQVSLNSTGVTVQF
jgi:hypothetical protein